MMVINNLRSTSRYSELDYATYDAIHSWVIQNVNIDDYATSEQGLYIFTDKVAWASRHTYFRKEEDYLACVLKFGTGMTNPYSVIEE